MTNAGGAANAGGVASAGSVAGVTSAGSDERAMTTGHFAAFTFVDRIVERVPGRSGRATFAIPAHLSHFPSCLVAEAVGQLAAWVAIEHLDFRVRPVAALAFETRFLDTVRPGDTLELEVDLDSCDDDAVAYQGRARVAGREVIRLVDCIGPMLPLSDFDDADAMRAFLAKLLDGGATPGRFRELPAVSVLITARERARSASALVTVPVAAPFFEDHFPRRAVFPATLLLDAQLGLATAVAREATMDAASVANAPGAQAEAAPVLARLADVKLRSFMPPGSQVEIGAELIGHDATQVVVRLTARMDGKRLGGARADFALSR